MATRRVACHGGMTSSATTSRSIADQLLAACTSKVKTDPPSQAVAGLAFRLQNPGDILVVRDRRVGLRRHFRLRQLAPRGVRLCGTLTRLPSRPPAARRRVPMSSLSHFAHSVNTDHRPGRLPHRSAGVEHHDVGNAFHAELVGPSVSFVLQKAKRQFRAFHIRRHGVRVVGG